MQHIPRNCNKKDRLNKLVNISYDGFILINSIHDSLGSGNYHNYFIFHYIIY